MDRLGEDIGEDVIRVYRQWWRHMYFWLFDDVTRIFVFSWRHLYFWLFDDVICITDWWNLLNLHFDMSLIFLRLKIMRKDGKIRNDNLETVASKKQLKSGENCWNWCSVILSFLSVPHIVETSFESFYIFSFPHIVETSFEFFYIFSVPYFFEITVFEDLVFEVTSYICAK